MTYHAGVGPFLAVMLNVDPGNPRITCDGCGVDLSAIKPSGMPYAWLLNKKAPPGWKTLRTADDSGRIDYCPNCKDAK